MRKAAVLARIAARDIATVTTEDLFHAATVGGAKALMRDDLGRLAPGKKADLVLLDLDRPQMRPARDPLRSFVYHAADRAVRDVFVDGQQGRRRPAGADAGPGRRDRPSARRAATDGSAGARRATTAAAAPTQIAPLSLPVLD